MKSSLALVTAAAIALSSCSSVYRTAQTPDDVYYSPGREASESYVQMNNQNDRAGRYRADEPSSSDEYYSQDDRVLRMRVRNPGMWSTFDDYGYGGYGMGYSPMFGSMYSPWGMGGYGMGMGGYGMGLGYGMGFGGLGMGIGYGGLGFGYNNFYNPYGGFGMGYNHFGYNPYNPYYYGGGGYYGGGNVGYKPSTPTGSRVRTFNPYTYSNRATNNANTRLGVTRPGGTRPTTNGYNNSNTNTLGTSIRRVFSNSNGTNSNSASRGDYYNPNSSRPSRTYQPSTQSSQSSPRTVSPSSTGSSGSSGGGGGARPAGGGGGGRPGRN